MIIFILTMTFKIFQYFNAALNFVDLNQDLFNLLLKYFVEFYKYFVVRMGLNYLFAPNVFQAF